MGEAAEMHGVNEVERPEPGPGEVLVRVHASGVNPTDDKARSGRCRGPSTTSRSRTTTARGSSRRSGPAWTPAASASGSGLWMAAAVPPVRTAAEWTALPARQAVPLPDGASFELGASLACLR